MYVNPNNQKFKSLHILFFLIFGIISSPAQYQMNLVPRSSPDNSISYKLGFTDINITYGSPFLKNRALWGELEPYDKVWRAGANNATTIDISNDITINETILAKGKYALFMIPRKDQEWVIIFSKNNKQWGAFRYKEEEDALRVNITPETLEKSVEKLTYKITETTPYSSAKITMEWGHTQINIPFTTGYINLLKESIHSRADSVAPNLKWVVFLQGAEFLVNEKKEAELALKWINQSNDLLTNDGEKWNKSNYFSGHIKWIQAKIYALKKDYKQAVLIAEPLQSKENKNKFYSRENEYEQIDESIKKWKSKQ